MGASNGDTIELVLNTDLRPTSDGIIVGPGGAPSGSTGHRASIGRITARDEPHCVNALRCRTGDFT